MHVLMILDRFSFSGTSAKFPNIPVLWLQFCGGGITAKEYNHPITVSCVDISIALLMHFGIGLVR